MPNTPTPTGKSGVDESVEARLKNFLSKAEDFFKSAYLLSSHLKKDNPDTFMFFTVSIFLNAICLELIVKMLWMIEKGEVVSKTHDVLSIFRDLDSSTRKHIENAFYNDETRKNTYEYFAKMYKESEGEDFPEENFREMLSRCSEVVVGFRYDPRKFSRHFLAGHHMQFLERMLKELEQKINPLANTQ